MTLIVGYDHIPYFSLVPRRGVNQQHCYHSQSLGTLCDYWSPSPVHETISHIMCIRSPHQHLTMYILTVDTVSIYSLLNTSLFVHVEIDYWHQYASNKYTLWQTIAVKCMLIVCDIYSMLTESTCTYNYIVIFVKFSCPLVLKSSYLVNVLMLKRT